MTAQHVEPDAPEKHDLANRYISRGKAFLAWLVRGNGSTEVRSKPPRESARDDSPAGNLIGMWRDLSLLAAGFAYLAGWQYIRSYYKQFEIDPAAMDIAINNYFVYAFFAIFNFWGGVLVSAFALITVLWNRLRARRVVHVITAIAFALSIFQLADREGTAAGRTLRLNFGQLPAVSFTFKDEALERRVAPDEAGAGRNWFLIAATKDKFLVLEQEDPDPALPERLPSAKMVLIPASEVVAGVRVKDVSR